MNKHTPGPWAASHNGTCWQVDASMDAVATTQFCYAPETEANARLIAAAPDLLAAAKNAHNLLAAAKHLTPDAEDARDKLAAAIAKATAA